MCWFKVLTRSAASFDHFDCTLNAREQTNLATHWLDLSHVYGTDSAQASKLRSFVGGRLKTSSIGSMGAGREFLPPADAGGCVDETNGEFCFESGDSRTSQNMMLVSIHTIWLREHNRLGFLFEVAFFVVAKTWIVKFTLVLESNFLDVLHRIFLIFLIVLSSKR